MMFLQSTGVVKRDREILGKIEEHILAPFAALSAEWTATRIFPEPEHPYRTAFQRDRDRIIHSRAFRRLKHKRQVFLTHSGDHYRTRLTHTLEVSQLARTMARTIGVNEDLVEAIALGHDLGHTPFGHVGEYVLDRIMNGSDNLNGVLKAGNLGGFKHNYQSLRVVDLNEKKYHFNGLNLTAAVREGILKHTQLRRESIRYPDFVTTGIRYELDNASTVEGQIVAVCDEIAQRTHDLEDGIRAHYVELEQVRTLAIVQKVENIFKLSMSDSTDNYIYRNYLIRGLIDYLVTDVIDTTLERLARHANVKAGEFSDLVVCFSDEGQPLQEELNRFIYQEIIATASDERSDDLAARTIRDMFQFYYMTPHLLPTYRLQPILNADDFTLIYRDIKTPDEQKRVFDIVNTSAFLRTICDHIAGMTDNFAEQEFEYMHTISGKKIIPPEPLVELP
jgi:dGTPase